MQGWGCSYFQYFCSQILQCYSSVMKDRYCNFEILKYSKLSIAIFFTTTNKERMETMEILKKLASLTASELNQPLRSFPNQPLWLFLNQPLLPFQSQPMSPFEISSQSPFGISFWGGLFQINFWCHIRISLWRILKLVPFKSVFWNQLLGQGPF